MGYFEGMRVLVTGGAGFVGSHLVDGLLDAGAVVTVYDNHVTGTNHFLNDAQHHKNCTLIEGDLVTGEVLDMALDGQDMVFHWAARADVRHSLEHPSEVLEINLLATIVLLDHMRAAKVRRMAFASTGSVYGSPAIVPTPEDCPFPIQNTVYGATKVASEALISAYASGFDMDAWIFRFVPMLGERYWHGHIADFVKKLIHYPDEMEVLGDGTERKFSLYVKDAIRGVLTGVEKGVDRVNIFNVGSDSSYSIEESVRWVARQLDVHPKLTYTHQRWVGDNPNMWLDCSKLKSLGWMPQVSAMPAVAKTVSYLLQNSFLLERDS
jgi:UDP-glucose 4-epimerase